MKNRLSFSLLVSPIVALTLLGSPSFDLGTSIASAPSPLVPDTTTADLAGRLGGTFESFEDRYGPGELSGQDWSYEVADFGLVQVYFFIQGRTGQIEGPAAVITLAPARTAAAAIDPDPVDWSLAEADRRARQFLPEDVRLGDPEPVGDHEFVRSCRSQTLGAVYGEPAGSGDTCRVALTAPTAATVSFVSLTLVGTETGDEEVATPVPPCDGLTKWAQATGERLNAADKLLASLAAMTQGDDATAHIDALATAFADLATAQRSEPTPSAAAVANDLLAAVFAAYAAALSDAAAALRTDDEVGVETAVAAITAAGEEINRGTDAMIEAFDKCGFVSASPEAIP